MSRNIREGVYAGKLFGLHRRTHQQAYKLFLHIPIPSWIWVQRKLKRQGEL